MNFEEVYKLTDTISHSTAFREDEARSLFNRLMELPDGSNILEVGVQFGRSFSVMLQVGKQKRFNVTAVDNFCEENGEDIFNAFTDNVAKCNYEYVLIKKDSREAHTDLQDNYFDLIHIDADHTYEGVKADILNYLPKLKKGGFICFHDYARDSLPGVYLAVNELLMNEDFEEVSHDYTFKVFRKI